MDTQIRLETARTRMAISQAFLLQAAQAGPPCQTCVYLRRTLSDIAGDVRRCTHPAYLELDFEPALGELKQNANVLVETARAEDGLCGPEGTLFERKLITPKDALAFLILAYIAAVILWPFGRLLLSAL